MQERKQILEMLAAGKLTPDEAEKLLAHLPATGDSEPPAQPPSSSAATSSADSQAQPRSGTPPAKPRYLRVEVDSHDGDRVNIRVPLELVRTGIKLGAMIPSEAREKLDQRGIDLSQFSGMEGEELVQALRELTVDVDTNKGDTVRVYCE